MSEIKYTALKLKDCKVKKEKGQIAIFLALLFVVIFTLFGLTINISMFVHDKINLQNSTDLAAYYVAQRQAEMLNAIAHTNYQMRQAWKLLAFRYRVIGTLGRKGDLLTDVHSHPALKSYALIDSNLRLDDSIYQTASEGVACPAAPYFFKELAESDYLCRNPNFSVSFITAGGFGFGGIGGAAAVTGNIKNVNQTIGSSCDVTTYFNWWYTTAAFVAFRNDQKARRRVIRALAENLALPIRPGPGSMRDLEGNSVYEGAFKTFKYNLSESNKEFGDNNDDYQLKFRNSLNDVSRQAWLPEITVDVALPYATFDVDGSGCRSGGPRVANLQVPPIYTSANAVQLRANLDPDGILNGEYGYDGGDSLSLDSVSVGVEKNPWYMVYNMVEATVYSKPLFSPNLETGSSGQRGISITAVSYAKPFGGRVGPWYSRIWPRDGTRSDGGGRNDPLYPPRATGSIGSIDVTDPSVRPNYSRYPSDKRGLTTISSMVSTGRLIEGALYGGPRPVSVNDMLNTYTSFYDPAPSADPLAQKLPDPTNPAVKRYQSNLRDIEIAAIVPDAFDVTHYSIFPGFWDNFGSKLNTWLPTGVGLEANLKIRGDLGFIEGEDGIYGNFDIINQIEKSQNVNRDYLTGSLPPYDRINGPWSIKKTRENKYAYLSGWNSGEDVMDYVGASSLSSRFANCERDISYRDDPDSELPPGRVNTPGECISGARVGYSVKLVSKDYLDANHPSLGGASQSGKIRNWPPAP